MKYSPQKAKFTVETENTFDSNQEGLNTLTILKKRHKMKTLNVLTSLRKRQALTIVKKQKTGSQDVQEEVDQ